MAARRGKSQARRNSGNTAGLPGWAWMVLGIVLTIVVVLAAPKFLKSEGSDSFFRPRPNPDARPATANGSEEDTIAPDDEAGATAKTPDKPRQTQYDFYTLLPGEEVAMSDAELAASARAEAERKTQQVPEQPSATVPTVAAAALPVPAPTAANATVASTAPTTGEAHYILQAGAFGASGDAEAVKAKIALLGLTARVESAQINDKTVYRVRMGPYGTASELAEAKHKLGAGGLPALAIKAK